MPTTNNINAEAAVGFKVGSQSAMDVLLAKKTAANAIEGHFYLTHDTHRLYVGNSDGSISSVNEGVITVDALDTNPQHGYVAGDTYLPALSANNAGQFYYVTRSNILCVWNGAQWVQINSNTDTQISSFAHATTVADNTATISSVIGTQKNDGTTGASSSAAFTVTGDGGIVVTDNDGTYAGIKITGDTYTISGVDGDASSNSAKIQLDSANTETTSAVTISGATYGGETGSNIEVKNDNGVIKIAARDSVNATLTAEANKLGTASNGIGFNITVTDNHGKAVGGTLTPKVTVGVAEDKKQTVDFIEGVASLDVYTKAELDDSLKALNAMTYRGTVGASGSAGIEAVGSNGTFVAIKKNATENLSDIAIGDTFLLAGDFNPGGSAPTYHAGTLLIAKGTEGTDGYITASSLTFDVVQETYYPDTTYSFVGTDKAISLTASTGGQTGSLKIDGGTVTDDEGNSGASINVTDSNATGSTKTLTIKHDLVDRNDTTGTTKTQIAANSTAGVDTTFKVPIITAVNTDATGHITGIETTEYQFKDTNGSITGNAFTTAVDGNKTVGTITNTVTFTEASNHATYSVGTTTIESSSLTVDTNTAKTGLSIDLLWGSFE